jgi:hypothetical protein
VVGARLRVEALIEADALGVGKLCILRDEIVKRGVGNLGLPGAVSRFVVPDLCGKRLKLSGRHRSAHRATKKPWLRGGIKQSL